MMMPVHVTLFLGVKRNNIIFNRSGVLPNRVGYAHSYMMKFLRELVVRTGKIDRSRE